VPPNGEGFDDCEELLVIDGIVELGGIKLPRMEKHGHEGAQIVRLKEDCS
jgi:hypothetical protein